MTATLERPGAATEPRYNEAVVAYVRALAKISDDFDVAEALMPEVDFIVRVRPEDYVQVSQSVLDVSYTVRERYGVRLSSVVVPYAQSAPDA